MEDIKMEGKDNTNINKQMWSSSPITTWKQVQEMKASLSSP
jgi:hypothetical protein